MSAASRRPRSTPGSTAIRTLVSTAGDEATVAAELLAQCAGAGPGLVVLFATMTLDLGRLGALLRVGGRDAVVGAATGRAIGTSGFLKHGVTGFLLPASRYAVADAVIEDSARLGPGEAALLVRGLRARLDAGPGAAFRQRFALLLVDAEPRCEERLTATLGLALSGIPLVGGSAGDLYFNPAGHRPDAPRVLAGTRSLPGGAVLLLVATDAALRATSHNHYTPGRCRVVITEAEPSRRVVREIDGRPALDAYLAACGQRGRTRDPGDFASHPLMIRIGGRYYPRGMQRIHADGSLEFACAVEPGIVMTVAEPGDMRERLAQLFDELRAAVGPPELVIGFDCSARTAAMERAGLTDSIATLMRRHRVVGFATLGEQFGTMHANNSFSCLALGSEPGS